MVASLSVSLEIKFAIRECLLCSRCFLVGLVDRSGKCLFNNINNFNNNRLLCSGNSSVLNSCGRFRCFLGISTGNLWCRLKRAAAWGQCCGSFAGFSVQFLVGGGGVTGFHHVCLFFGLCLGGGLFCVWEIGGGKVAGLFKIYIVARWWACWKAWFPNLY